MNLDTRATYRKEIIVNDNEYLVVKNVIMELSRDSDIFQKDRRLVWHSHGRIHAIPHSIVRSKITRLCVLIEHGRHIHPPSWLISGVMASGSYPDVPFAV